MIQHCRTPFARHADDQVRPERDEHLPMREKLHLDIYTVLIIALIPFFLLTAWGLTWNYERVLANRACEDTTNYLEEATALAPEVMNAGTLQNAGGWVGRMAEMRPPPLAEDLHDSIVNTATYATNSDPGLDTTQPAGVFEKLTPFQDPIIEGRDKIIAECPELADAIPDAFPMFFTKENS